VEALQEVVNLPLNLAVELEEAQLLDVLTLVLVADGNVLAVFNELHLERLPEVVGLGNEGGHQALDVVLEAPLHVVVEFVVKVFQVGEAEGLTCHDLVKGLNEVALEEALIEDSFTHHAPDELEVAQVLHLHMGLRVGVVSGARRRQDEERIVRVEHLSG
jgi:hypothetical protein